MDVIGPAIAVTFFVVMMSMIVALFVSIMRAK